MAKDPVDKNSDKKLQFTRLYRKLKDKPNLLDKKKELEEIIINESYKAKTKLTCNTLNISPLKQDEIDTLFQVKEKTSEQENKSTMKSSSVEKYLWEIYEKKPTKKLIAKLVDLLFHVEEKNEINKICTKIFESDENLYMSLPSETRTKLLLETDQDQPLYEVILQTLKNHKDNNLLNNIEKLIISLKLIEKKEYEALINYYIPNEVQILQAFQEKNIFFGKCKNYLFYSIGHTSYKIGMIDKAVEVLLQIEVTSHFFKPAVQIILENKCPMPLVLESQYCRQLMETSSYLEKIELIDSFLKKAHLFKDALSHQIIVLNEILREPYQWVSSKRKYLKIFSQTLIKHINLSYYIPQFLNFYKINAFNIQAFEESKAIWQPVFDAKIDHPLLKGFSYLQLYLNSKNRHQENFLWLSKNLINEDRKKNGSKSYNDWEKIRKWILEKIKHPSNLFDQKKRQKIFQEVSIATDPSQILIKDAIQYIKRPERNSHEGLVLIEKFAVDKKSNSIQLEILRQKASLYHLRNKDILRFWELCIYENKHDLAWRASSILEARQALPAPIRKYWKLSGEANFAYHLQDLNYTHIDCSLQGFSNSHKKMILILISIGLDVNDLLAMTQKNLNKISIRKFEHSDFEKNLIFNLTNAMNIKKDFFWCLDEQLSLHTGRVPFIENLETTEWTKTLVMLPYFLGVNSWSWNTKILFSTIKKNFSSLALHSKAQDKQSLSKWLKKMNSEKILKLKSLTKLSEEINSDNFKNTLFIFFSRLATCLIQDNFGALQSLKKMNTPVEFIWNLENWILSDKYTKLRKKSDTDNHNFLVNESNN
ncbi:MAG: hypothetical protein CMP11_09130 [Zetaproteobacteria bacterium]|nr:hypothetical protein [Pseudobdellovibrionaceae bacterium]